MMVLLLVLIAASALIQFKAQGMMIALARHTAEGRRPTFRQVLDSTRGLVRRALVLLLVGLAFLALLYLVMGVVAFAVIMAAAQANAGDSSSTAGLVFALLLLALPLSLIAGLYLSTRLYYVMPALTLEEASGLTPLSRSWSLTKGEFWRTLGWTLAAYILVALLSYAVNVVASLATGPMQVRLSTMDSEDPAAVLAVLIPAMIITSVGSALAQVLTVPALAIYQTVMFIDQIRRKQLPGYVPGRPYVPYGLATGYAPGPYQPAAQQYPPQQQHPQQPYSQPGYPPEQYPDGSQRSQQPPYPGPTAPQ